jgi:hypothetical protein
MTRRLSSAASIVRTEKSARASSSSPFRKGSVRDSVFRFLQTPKTLGTFVKYIETDLGADVNDVFRFFGKRGLTVTRGGKVLLLK